MRKKSILVTGASRGIGRAIALKFAQKGYNVAINCIHNKEKLLDVQKEIESHHVECLAYVGDMGKVDDCQKLFSKIQSTWQSLDVLVNNAGISYIGLLQDMSEDEWNHMINNNLTSVFHCSKLAIPLMLKENRGKIINISSVVSGRNERWGSGRLRDTISSSVSPAPVCRSHTRACCGNPSSLSNIAPMCPWQI